MAVDYGCWAITDEPIRPTHLPAEISQAGNITKTAAFVGMEMPSSSGAVTQSLCLCPDRPRGE